MDIGEKIEAVRRSCGWKNRKDAVEPLGCSEKTLGNYERGDRMPDIEFLARFARITGTDFYELIRLRLEAVGESVDIMKVAEPNGEYRTDKHKLMARKIPEDSENLSEVRRCLVREHVPVEWSTLIVHLFTAGDLSQIGAMAVIEELKHWHPDRQWLEERLSWLSSA